MSTKKAINQATPEDIKTFLEGHDPEKYITSIELDQTDDWSVDNSNKIYMIIDDPKKGKKIKTQKFTPFCWTKSLRDSGFYDDDMDRIKKAARKHGIYTEKLETGGNERLENGFKYIVKSSGTYRDLVNFFKRGGINPWDRDRRLVQILPPVEQFLIQTGKRLFKGYEDYTEVHKLTFDIETTSLYPEQGHCFMIGVKDNRGFRQLLNAYDDEGNWDVNLEKKMYEDFFEILHKLEPTVIVGYNSENFDWHFILSRMEILGISTVKTHRNKKDNRITSRTIDSDIIRTKHPLVKLKRKVSSLKLGAEVEDYEQTQMWGYNVMDTYHRVRQAMALNSSLQEGSLKYIAKEAKVERPNRVYIEGDKLGKIWSENKEYNYNPTSGQWYDLGGVKPDPKQEEDKETHELVTMTGYEDKWEVVNGHFLIKEYLNDDLLETEQVDDIYTQAGFLTAALVPTNFIRSITMGTATMWKTLMMAWSYENGLALPGIQPKRNFVGGLSRLLNLGYSRNIAKFDYASLYPSIQLTHNVFPNVDISGALKAMLKYLLDTRNEYKYLAGKYKEEGNEKLAGKFDKKQLPIKIFNNSAFGSISAPYIFPWGNIDIGETITCTGRQYLRHLIQFFMERGYKPLVLDTDGVNFSYDEAVLEHTYVGRGFHRFSEKDKVYKGIDADVAEYNDRFMYGAMGLDIDDIWPATINISRKNYATLKPNGKIKLTGNTIKGKAIPKYIKTFLDKGIKMLLNGQGKEFVDYYYSYMERIYNMDIPLAEIANKSRVKKTIKQYKNRGLNKNGKSLPRQAHMELIIKENLHVDLGETIYYINNGTRKSHGDIQVRKRKTDPPEGTLVFNCYHIDKESMDTNPNLKGEYNIAKYIDAFNKKVTPLLVVFNKNVRDVLVITDPAEKQYFTNSELELVNGIATEEGDQDTLEELMTISDEELVFWEMKGISPEYMICDRFDGIKKSLDSKDQKMVNKMSNIRENKFKLS
jgi:DNA polymerase elongation subunit (family B)